MIKRYFSIKKLGLTLLLAGLMLVLTIGPALSALSTLLEDGFERPDTFVNWDDNGVTSWNANPSIFHSGLRSARASNNNEGLLTSDNLDASGAVGILVDFWFYKIATSDTGFTLYYYNGSTYNLIAELDGYGGGADNTWIHYTQTITDSQYFVSNFRIQFDATLAGGQFAYVDDVKITKDTGETLTVSTTGSGTVTSTPAGIDCGLDCSEKFATNATVTLTPAAAVGSTFAGWSGTNAGDLTDNGDGTWSIVMDEAKSVTADFTQIAYTLTVVSPHGTVTKDPDQATYNYGTEVLLTMGAVDPGWTFTGWSGGGCTGTDPCTVTVTANTTVTANFTQDEYTLTIIVVGNGSVAKVPNQATYHYGDVVQLTATPDFGWSFASWSGDLTSTTNPDSITMTGNKTVTALFVKFHLYFPEISKQP